MRLQFFPKFILLLLLAITGMNYCGKAQTIAPITGPDSVCLGANITLSDASPGGTWISSNPGVATIGSATGIVTGISHGIANIKYGTGASSDAVKIITVDKPGAGEITIGAVNTFCIGDKAFLFDTAAIGIWNLSNDHIKLIDDTMTAVSAGLDTIFYTVTNACGTAIAIDSIWVACSLPLITGNMNICIGDTSILFDSVWGGMWQGGAHVNLGDNLLDSGILVGISTGTGIITYQMDLGCHTTAVVTVNPLPNAGIITGFNTACFNTSMYLNDPMAGGIWTSKNPGISTIDPLTGKANAIGYGVDTILYTVAANLFGCINKATFTLTIAPFTSAGTITDITCYGANNGAIFLTVHGGSPPLAYTWLNGATTTSLAGLAPGEYTVRITDASGTCNLSDSFIVTQPDSLAVSSSVKSEHCFAGNGSISIAASGGTAPYKYLWSNNATSDNIDRLAAGAYTLTLTDFNGCLKKTIIDVQQIACTQVVIHDGISPNGDGINDTWVIDGLQDYPKNTVQVFDKFGDLVFERTNYNNDWSGAGKNGLLPDGTYYYLVKLNSDHTSEGINSFPGTLLIKR